MNSTLRLLLLVALLFAGPAFATAPTKTEAAPTAPSAEQNYWLTIRSGIRHNSKCRYFHNSQGRPCGKDEGRACKLCGG